ncbi:MAG TPA: hypothetical protein VFK09_00645 [Gemmatimonadales bacterium]|jgi:hypothetical protein|nr:hypothetical protein [Gemmatimonadales bacterium]
MASVDSRRVVAALYPVAALLILAPAVDLAGAVLPPRISEVTWRFGTFGLFANALLTPVLGLTLLLIATMLHGKRGATRTIAVVFAGLAILLLIGAALFALDFVQLRGTVAAQAKRPYDVAALKALIDALLMCAATAWLARIAFAASPKRVVRDGHDRVGLVVQLEGE